VDLAKVGHIVAVVLEWRGQDRHQPQTGHAQLAQVVELFNKPAQIARTVAVAVVEAAHVDFVEDGVLVPQAVSGTCAFVRPLHEALRAMPLAVCPSGAPRPVAGPLAATTRPAIPGICAPPPGLPPGTWPPSRPPCPL